VWSVDESRRLQAAREKQRGGEGRAKDIIQAMGSPRHFKYVLILAV
jgi:hypothetical protein